MIKACMIERDKVFEADMIEDVATTNDIESKVAMDESTTDSRVETFPTLLIIRHHYLTFELCIHIHIYLYMYI